MPIQALTKSELESRPPSGRLHKEYVAFMSSARLGSGGKLEVAQEKTTKQTIKKRLQAAADAAGKKIQFHRSPAEVVIFQVVE